MHTAGIILCGGNSTRMGAPKALLPVGDELMLQRVARLLGGAVHPLVVVAAQGQELPPLEGGAAIVRDSKSDQGPLQGLRDGLAALPADVDAAFVSACDLPLLQPSFVTHIIAQLGEHDIAAPREGKFHHVLAAVYRRSVLPKIDELLAKGERKLQRLLECCATRSIDVAGLRAVDPDRLSLINCNDLQTYQIAMRRLGIEPGLH